MFTDEFLRVSGGYNGKTPTGQTITAVNSTTSVVSTNSVDIVNARDIGEGSTMYGVFNINTAVTGQSGLEMEVILASDAGLVNDIEPIASTGVLPNSKLTINSIHAVKFSPQVGDTGQRYLGARYSSPGTISTGAVSCNFVETIQDGKKFYPSGWSV